VSPIASAPREPRGRSAPFVAVGRRRFGQPEAEACLELMNLLAGSRFNGQEEEQERICLA
jgi:hypothetical protein